MSENPLVFLYWIVSLLALFEARVSHKHGTPVYSKARAEISIGISLGYLFVALTLYTYLLQLIKIAPEHKLAVLPSGIGWGILAFLALDLAAYLTHWFSHKNAFFWSDHAVHHASADFNLFTHIQHGWTSFASTSLLISVFFGLFGNMDAVLVVYFFVTFTVQTLAHTQLIHKLGFLEWFMVTPSHHRVHHCLQREVHDHNYGIVFIFWDKLFGTFMPEGDEQISEFGLKDSPGIDAPLWEHAFFGWQDYFKNWHLTKTRIL